jgi:nitrite reductase/ring-hydroxylating ferredoxin subunit
MTDHFFGWVDEFEDGAHRVREVAGVEVGVFRLGDDYVAWENACPHAGGPVCQGRIMPRVEEKLDGTGQSLGMAFSKERRNIVCPWHGYEFDLRTGCHQGHDGYRLRSITVSLRGREILVKLPESRTPAAAGVAS